MIFVYRRIKGRNDICDQEGSYCRCEYVTFDLKQLKEQNRGQGAKTVFNRPQK